MSDPAPDETRRGRARGCLLGLACGDALGRPVAGDTAAAVRDRHGRVTDLLGGDRPAGSTTAVTAAALDTARGMLDGAAGPRAFAATSTSDGGTALAGAVPYGLARGDADARADAAVAGVAEADGADAGDDSVESCVATAVLVGELVDGAAVDAALDAARTVALDRGAPVPLRETLAVVGDHAAVTVDTGGGVAGTLETGLHDAVVAADPEEAVVSAASRGGAASAVAAVAGAFAGASAGAAALPARWLNGLDGVDEIAGVADEVAALDIDP